MDKPSGIMSGKVCMVTGSNSGIGKVTARELARMGAIVIMVCRSRDRGERARKEIISDTGNESVELMMADLSSLQAVRELAADLKERLDRLHVLVNNAAIWPTKRSLTVDGLEMQFAVNYLAPFLLTNLLLDVIQASSPARIVNVSSGLHMRAKIDFENLQAEKRFRHFSVYGQTKLANVLFTYELARRLEGTGVTVNSANPGMTSTNLGRYMSSFSRFIMRRIAKSAEEGARTSIYLASSPEVEGVTGKYFSKCTETRSSDLSHDENIARRLWEVSEKLSGLIPSAN